MSKEEKKDKITLVGMKVAAFVAVSMVLEILFMASMATWHNPLTVSLTIIGFINVLFWGRVYLDWEKRARKELGLK